MPQLASNNWMFTFNTLILSFLFFATFNGLNMYMMLTPALVKYNYFYYYYDMIY